MLGVILAGCGRDSSPGGEVDAQGRPIRPIGAPPYDDITVGDGQQAVENGDIVDIGFVGMIDGVAFGGGSADNYYLDIGSGMFIDGFEEGIIGMKAGGVRDIYIAFPVDYHAPDFAGKEVVFRITLHYIAVERSGSFILELYPEYAPLTVENFLNLVDQNFYNGIVFHRIMDGFMAQGGCPYGQGYGGSGQNIDCETINNGWAQNTLKHTPGVISMAHAGPNTGSSQFFIMFGDAPTLDGQHAGFGKVVEGFEVVQALQTVPRNYNERNELASPMRPATIISMARIADSADGNPRVQVEINYMGE